MSSSPAVSAFYPQSDQRSGKPLTHQPKSYDWTQPHDLRDSHDGLDRSTPQDRSSPKESQSSRRTGSGVQRMSFSPSPLIVSSQPNSEYMKSNPKSAAPLEPFVRDSSVDDFASGLRRAGNRWSFNGSEKMVEPSLASWDLVDEIGKLGIANDAGDVTDGTTTPPKNNMRDVLHIHESSPLDTSSSDTSLDSTSPQNAEGANLPSHSRESSTDTLNSESSVRSNAHLSSLKSVPFSSDLTKDRPRSFSGAISDVELRRLQNIPTPSQLPESLQDRSSPLIREVTGGDNKPLSSVPSGENIGGQAQPMYPSLAAYPSAQQQQNTPFVGLPLQNVPGRQEELQVDPMIQPRQQFVNSGQNLTGPFIPVQANGPVRAGHSDIMPYRQQVRGMNMFQPPMQMQAQAPPALLSSPTNFAYQGVPNPPGHHNALSLGTSQQMYNMMLPMDPAVNRTQQVFRAGHQHSASDPASLRDAAQLLLNAGVHGMQGMQFPPTPALTPGLYPPMAMTPPVYANQFFPGANPQPQEVYSQQDMMSVMGRSLPHFTGTNGAPTTPQAAQTNFAASPSPPNSTGPSANNRKLGLYKTELCRSWEEKGTCRYGPKCQFAHGEEEIRKVARHPKYKTEICRTFWVSGSCPYGKRCCFIHTELPTSGTPPGATGATDGNAPPPPPQDGRTRSMSTNSDPNEGQTSLLARIKGKNKSDDSTGSATPTATSAIQSPAGYQFAHKPPSGALRVDTNVEAPMATKQNKSAYPTFANTSIQALSPGPVTAGPDFGRHLGSGNVNLSEINQRINGNASTPNARHSYTSSEASIAYGQQPQQQQSRNVSGGSSPFGILSTQTDSPATTNAPGGHGLGHGHSRSGSASNWGSFSQKSHLAASASPYTHTPSPGNDGMSTNTAAAASPWGPSDLNANTRQWS